MWFQTKNPLMLDMTHHKNSNKGSAVEIRMGIPNANALTTLRCIYNLPPLAQNGINDTTPQRTLTAVLELCFQLSNQQSGVSTPGGWFWSCAAVLFQHVSWAQWRGLAPVWKLWQFSNLCREIQTKSNDQSFYTVAIGVMIHMFLRQRFMPWISPTFTSYHPKVSNL